MTVLLEDLLKQTNIPHPEQLRASTQLEERKALLEERKALLDLYADLQGNILKSHGRIFSVHLFLEFQVEKICETKQWISNFAETFVTSVSKQRKSTLRYKELRRKKEAEPAPSDLFTNFFLSSDGYKTLFGWSDTQFEDYFKGSPFEDSPFANGMKNKNGIDSLNDPPVECWEEGFRKKIHALILLADGDADFLSTHAENVEREVKEFATIVHSEFGKVFRNENNKPIEHFGFIDGISQPLFFKDDVDEYIHKDATDKWDPRAPIELALVKDPLNPKEYSCGSFLVYRKLQQHVDFFKKKIGELAEKLQVEKELAEAFVVGRFKDGTPVTLYNRALSPNMIPNNFDYQSDIHGTRCPFHAHIRKTNPRGEKTTDPNVGRDEQRERRIARRAISYCYPKGRASGSTEVALKYLQLRSIDTIEIGTTEEEVGLLFMCFQGSITKQFITLQKTWANNIHFPKNYVGTDPIIGQVSEELPQLESGQYWSKGENGWDENHKGRYDFSSCVQMKGGEYFFAPSISFLVHLPTIEPPARPVAAP